jgi:hypothetical protein
VCELCTFWCESSLRPCKCSSKSMVGIPLPDLPPMVKFRKKFIEYDEASKILVELVNELPWERHKIRTTIGMREEARWSVYYCTKEILYKYSGNFRTPLKLSSNPTLSRLAERISAFANAKFNSMLINFYPNNTNWIK